MSLGLNKIILANAGANTPGAYYQITTIYATTAGNVVPAGSYVMFATANVNIQAASAYNSTTNTPTWSNVTAAGVGAPFLVSDGVNVQLLATSNANVTLLTVDGGQNVNGTYNAS